MMNYNKHTEHDEQLRELFHQQLPDAADNDWFRQRLMNRLPERRRPLLPRVIQTGCYALALLLMIGLWVYAMVTTAVSGLTFTGLLLAALIPALFLVCLLVCALPQLKRVL